MLCYGGCGVPEWNKTQLHVKHLWEKVRRTRKLHIQLLLAVCAQESCLLESSAAVFTVSHSSRLCILSFVFWVQWISCRSSFSWQCTRGGYSTVGLQQQATPSPTNTSLVPNFRGDQWSSPIHINQGQQRPRPPAQALLHLQSSKPRFSSLSWSFPFMKNF